MFGVVYEGLCRKYSGRRAKVETLQNKFVMPIGSISKKCKTESRMIADSAL